MSAASPPSRIVLHIGAHKTASTHFHMNFRTNWRALQPLGWSCPKKRFVREYLTDLLRSEKHLHPKPEDRDSHFAEMAAGLPNLLLPDENILGTTEFLFQNGRFYPRAARRLRIILEYLEGCDVDVMLAIRDPATFLPSAYGEAIRKSGYFPYADFLDHGSEDQLDWSVLIQRLRNVVPRHKSLTVWRFEDYFTKQEVIQRKVLGLSQDDDFACLTMDAGVVRPGISSKAYEALKVLGQTNDRAQIEAIIDRYPKSADLPAMQIFSPQRRAELSEKYAQDVARIRNMPRVQFLDPARGEFVQRKRLGLITRTRLRIRRFLP